jgi:peptidoglycan/xylan/chitin deacetylase (PgdA/CDA1 family)
MRIEIGNRVRVWSPVLLTAAIALGGAVHCTSNNNDNGGGTDDSGGTGGPKGMGGKGAGGSKGSGGKGAGGTSAEGGSGDGGTSGEGGKGSGGTSASGGTSGDGGATGQGGSASGGSSAGGITGSGGTIGTGGTAAGGTGAGGSVVLTPLTGNGCAGGTCLNPTCKALGTAAAVGTFAELGFELQPSYIPNDVIIPTFDDAPDGQNAMTNDDGTHNADYDVYGPGEWTKKLITWFDMNNMHMDFFINTNNWCGDVAMDPACMLTIESILKTQNPANHTIHHIHMGGNTPPVGDIPDSCGGAQSKITCDEEMKGVEAIVDTVSNGGRPHLTRFRAPYGEPFQAQGTGFAQMKTLVAKYAVHVGWNLDSGDSTCESTTAPCFTGQQIADNVTQLIGTAPGQGQRWGVVLMHGTFPWTHDAAKILFDPTNGYMKKHNFRVGTVEDAICWRYGKHSWEIVKQLNPSGSFGPN